MKTHTTNYIDTFIAVADDCAATSGEVPPTKGDAKTVAKMQYDMINSNPYKYTSDDVLFQVYADRKDLISTEHEAERKQFFSKGQPCFRASPLSKRYGWGVHSNNEGKIAIFGQESSDYTALASDPKLKVLKAMKSSKKNWLK